MTGSDAVAALGLDVGGTSTRAVVLDPDGRRLGYGKAGGGNLSSHRREAAFDAVFDAIGAALADAGRYGIGPAAIAHAVIGAAGAGHYRRPDTAAELAQRWAHAGLTCSYQVESDAVVAFVAGTERPDGTLVLSGTGALASALHDRRMTRTIDGHGWLVGDAGSAFWLGREAVVHTLHLFDIDAPASPLARAVLRHYGIDHGLDDDAPRVHRSVQADLEVAVYREPPVNLASLAPLVTSHVDDDPAAGRIIDDAAAHLLNAAALVRSADDATPVVLAGSLLITDTPLAGAVRAGIARTWPAAPVGAAHDGASAAAWLALIRGGLVSGADAAARTHRAAVHEGDRDH